MAPWHGMPCPVLLLVIRHQLPCSKVKDVEGAHSCDVCCRPAGMGDPGEEATRPPSPSVASRRIVRNAMDFPAAALGSQTVR